MTVRIDVHEELIRGDVEEGYGPVADAFRRNFTNLPAIHVPLIALAGYLHVRNLRRQ